MLLYLVRLDRKALLILHKLVGADAATVKDEIRKAISLDEPVILTGGEAALFLDNYPKLVTGLVPAAWGYLSTYGQADVKA